MKYNEWTKTKEDNPNYKCRKCGSGEVIYYADDDDDHGDIHYRCPDCKADWWYEGPDA